MTNDDREDLFAHYPEAPGHVAGCDTSKAAADSIDAGALSRMRREVLNVIAVTGIKGATCDEVEIALDLKHQTASARIRELVLFDLIHDSGRRRLTRSNRTARVYTKKAAAP